MRRSIAWLLLLAVLMTSASAVAEGPYTMAGFDGDGSKHDWQTNLFFQRMEEKTGIAFEFSQQVEYSAWTAEKAAYLRGDSEVPDVLFKAELTPAETMELLEAGKIIDLKPYLETAAPNLTALLKAHPDWEAAITLPGGEIAALPGISTLQSDNAMWINREWLDRLGLSVPTTADELTEVLRAFKTGDPNRNGKQDEAPLTFLSMWDLKFLGHAFGIIANDYNVVMDENGQVSSPLTTEENRAFLTWLRTLWTEGLLDKNGFTTADNLRLISDAKADIPYGVLIAPTPCLLCLLLRCPSTTC